MMGQMTKAWHHDAVHILSNQLFHQLFKCLVRAAMKLKEEADEVTSARFCKRSDFLLQAKHFLVWYVTWHTHVSVGPWQFHQKWLRLIDYCCHVVFPAWN